MNTQTAAAVPDNYLSINNIEVIYDHVILVLKGVSLNVPKGKIVALLGANGAGKSTTLKTISNLLHAERGDVTKGNVEFKGDVVHELTPSLPVAFMSGYAREDLLQQGQIGEEVPLVHKPFVAADLCAALDRLCPHAGASAAEAVAG